jgi:2-hydroxy-3-oxopropionate reductase
MGYQLDVSCSVSSTWWKLPVIFRFRKETMQKTIGFIGLGIMGKHMASHLLKAGYHLVAYDLLPDNLEKIVALGAEQGNSPADVAKRSDLVISMVPDSPDVEKVALGVNGIEAAARPGLIYIDMSTISPGVACQVASRLGEKGIRCLDAPVSGGETGAQNATLSIMVGGPQDLLEEVKPVLDVMGKTITRCGENGAGQIVKACNQIQVAMNMIGMAEALVLGTKAGVDPAVILKVLGGGYAQNRVMDVRGPRLIQGDFTPGFKGKFHLKDLNIVMDTARDLNVPLPASTIVHELFQKLIETGRGDLDHSAVITILEDLAGIKARTQRKD